jgi:diamine N-acetyltransferase
MLLQGKHLQLRALEPKDLDLLYIWENDPEVWSVSGTLTPFSRFVIEQYLTISHQDIYSSKELRLMIDVAGKSGSNSKSIGCIDLFDFDPKNKRAGIGILIGDESERRKGYAAEAVEIVIEYCFTTLDLHQVYCSVIADNQDSLALFRKLNFETTGTRKDWNHNKGQFVDEYFMQFIRK